MNSSFWDHFDEMSPNDEHSFKIPQGLGETDGGDRQIDILSSLSLITSPSEELSLVPTVSKNDDEVYSSSQVLLLLTRTKDNSFVKDLPRELQSNDVGIGADSDVLAVLPNSSFKYLPPPDISGGLGRSREKRDIVDLEKYICMQLPLMAYKGELWLFDAPCWQRLDLLKATIRFRRLLDKDNLSDVLTTSEYRTIYQLLLSDPTIQHEADIDPPLHRLNLRDGTLDLQSMIFYPHDPEDGFFTFLNLSFREITAMDAGPTFEAFVSKVGNHNSEIRQQLLELIALAIARYEAKVFYVLLGESNTGKTQFGRFLEELLGRENVASFAGVHDFANRFATSALEDKLLATCLDLPDEPLPSVAIGTIKQVVGDDPIKIEAKYKNSRTIYHKPLLLFAGNHPVRIPGIERETALLNRMVVIPFSNPVSPQEMQPQLYKQLLDEAPYIVAQAIQAYQALIRRNFVVTRVPLPAQYAPQDSRDSYQAVIQFVAEYCQFSPNCEIDTQSLYLVYQDVAAENSFPMISEIEFSRRLSEHLRAKNDVKPIKRSKDTGRRGYQGIGLRDGEAL